MNPVMAGEARQQVVSLARLDAYVTQNNPIRVIEALVDERDPATLGRASLFAVLPSH